MQVSIRVRVNTIKSFVFNTLVFLLVKPCYCNDRIYFIVIIDYVKSYNRMIKVSNNDLYRNVYKYVFFGTSIKEFKRVRGYEYYM